MTRAMNITEESLARRMQAHDSNAMRQFYSLTVGYLTAICSRYVSQEDDVKDVLQESYLKIFGSIDHFAYRGEGSLKAWATRITMNEALISLRNSAHIANITYMESLPEVAEDDPNVDDVPPEVIQRFIRELPVGYRTVFNLFVFEDHSHQEIAEMLHIKESSSASQLSRAKSILAKKINDYKATNNK